MTSIPGLTGDRLYLDTNIFIYFIEGHVTHAAILRELFKAIDVATALERGCRFFLTEDSRVRTPSTLPELRLGELTGEP